MADETNEAVLQEQNAQYKKDLDKAQKDLDKAQKALAKAQDAQEKEVTSLKEEHAKEVTDLQNQLTDERTRSGNLAADLNESENLTEELQSKLATAALLQAKSDTVIVTDGTHHYKVLAPKFKHKHVDYTADDLKTNEALVQELVGAGIGFLQKIETAE